MLTDIYLLEDEVDSDPEDPPALSSLSFAF